MFEALESRRLMSVGLQHGVLLVKGTSGDDVITIERNEQQHHKIDVTVNGHTRIYRAGKVHGIVIKAYDGDDVVAIADDVYSRAKLYGGEGDDELTAGAGKDLVNGGLGDDDLDGGPRKDRIYGIEGEDVFQSTDALKEMQDLDEDDGVRIRLDEAPSAVQSAVLKLLAGNDFENLLRETDEGETVFELEWDAPGPHSAKINLAGEVVELEVEIEVASLPAVVSDAVLAKYPDGEITEAETLELPGQAGMFEVEVAVPSEGIRRELVITATGEILADEVEGPIED